MVDERIVENSTAIDLPTVAEDTSASVVVEQDVDEGMSRKNIRHNMIVCVMLDTIWATGWMDFQIVLQPLLAYLKASNVIVGFVNGATIFNYPGTFFSPFISRRFPLKKWYLFVTNVPYMGMIGITGLILALSEGMGLGKEWLLPFVVIAIGAHKVFEGFVALPHQEYVAQCIPMSHRGRYTGYSNTFGSTASLVSAAVGAWVLSSVGHSLMFSPAINISWLHLHYNSHYSYVLFKHVSSTFAFGSLCLMTWFICQSGYAAALFAREKRVTEDEVPHPWSKAMFLAAWNDKPWLRVLCVVSICGTLFGYGNNFIQQYGFRDLHLPYSLAAYVQLLTLVGRLVVSVPAGYVVDRFGPKKIMYAWPFTISLAMAWPLIFPSQYGIYLNVLNQAILWWTWSTAFWVLLYSLPKPEHRAGHYTFQILIQASAQFVGPLWAGLCCDKLGYHNTFLIFSIGALCTFPFFKWAVSSLSDDRKAYG